MYIESRYLVGTLSSKKARRDVVFGFLRCVVPGAIFRVSSRYLVFFIFDLEKRSAKCYPYFFLSKAGDIISLN